MKKMRKGFTLVELLIVIAILGTLSATMSVATSGSSAKAKAAAIVSNVDACKSAANLYVLNTNDDVSEKMADEVLKVMLPTWVDFSNTDDNEKGSITYKGTTDKGSDSWAIEVDFSADPEKAAIKKALQKIKGYNKYNNGSSATDIMGENVYAFKVVLTTGQVLPKEEKSEEEEEESGNS